jgi:hypothetical protein
LAIREADPFGVDSSRMQGAAKLLWVMAGTELEAVHGW